MDIRTYQDKDQSQVIALWKECGLLVAWNNPYTDIERKVSHSPDLFFVVENEQNSDEITAVVMVGYDGHRGNINYLAVKPELQGSGLGKSIMAFSEKTLIERGCPKINLFVRATNSKVIQFYKGLGFTVETAVGIGKRLIDDDSY